MRRGAAFVGVSLIARVHRRRRRFKRIRERRRSSRRQTWRRRCDGSGCPALVDEGCSSECRSIYCSVLGCRRSLSCSLRSAGRLPGCCLSLLRCPSFSCRRSASGRRNLFGCGFRTPLNLVCTMVLHVDAIEAPLGTPLALRSCSRALKHLLGVPYTSKAA